MSNGSEDTLGWQTEFVVRQLEAEALCFSLTTAPTLGSWHTQHHRQDMCARSPEAALQPLVCA